MSSTRDLFSDWVSEIGFSGPEQAPETPEPENQPSPLGNVGGPDTHSAFEDFVNRLNGSMNGSIHNGFTWRNIIDF